MRVAFLVLGVVGFQLGGQSYTDIICFETRIIKSLRQNVAMAIETESTLVEQSKDAELEYRVIAINKSGEGQPSNTVIVVL